jgi:hypothetical protein
MTQNESMTQDALNTCGHAAGVSSLASEPDAGMELLELGASPQPDWNSPEGDIRSNDAVLVSSTGVQKNLPSETRGLKNRKPRAVVEDKDKWLLVCLPGKTATKDPGLIEHLPAKIRKDDNSLIQEIKKSYESGRSGWTQFRQLHGFSKVKLIKVSNYKLLK